MNRLQSETLRLFPAHDDLGSVRAMVLKLDGPAAWDNLANAWRGVQADLQLPAPAIAVSGAGYELWFSLAQPVAAGQASAFLGAVRKAYLGEAARKSVAVVPAPGGIPPIEVATGHWSAFVAADLAALFAEEPWLDIPPSPDAQADLLARLDSMRPEDMERALEQLRPATVADPGEAPATGSPGPKAFLLGIMNDPSLDLNLRIEAAKALLPYFEE